MTTDDDRLVLDAIRSGDPQRLEEVASLVGSFPDGEEEDTARRWILHAIAEAPLATVEWMLDSGVDLSFCDEAGYTPLLAAVESAREDRLDVLRRLIAAGAPLNVKGINDWTPAHMAAARDDVEALRLLVDSGADLSIRTAIDGYATPLEEARELGKTRAVAFLESYEAAPADDSPFPGWRPVVESGHMPLIQDMLRNHDIRSEIVPGGTRGKASAETLWVKAADHARALELVRQMAAALETPSSGPWHCAGCGEENDATFDVCWQCGRDHSGS